jgi:transcriptional regulator with XRE-family HTH domain
MFRKSREETSKTEEAFYRHISEKIKEIRNKRGMSQSELAQVMYKTGKAVSDIERGRVHVDLFDLSLIAKALDKPISSFFPPFLTEGSEDDLSPDERELLLLYRKIWDEKLREIALRQVRSIAEAEIEAHREDLRQAREDQDH